MDNHSTSVGTEIDKLCIKFKNEIQSRNSL